MDITTNEPWQKITASYEIFPRDVVTTPKNKSTPRWFYVYSDGESVFVESGRSHDANQSEISGCIKLVKNDFDTIYPMYNPYKCGSLARSEIITKNRNSSYWFGIFSDLQM